MALKAELPSNTPDAVKDLVEQLERERDSALAELESFRNPTKPDVRTIKDKKEYERMKAEALRSLARARLGGPVTPPEPKDVRSMTKEEYQEYKRLTMDAVRQRRS